MNLYYLFEIFKKNIKVHANMEIGVVCMLVWRHMATPKCTTCHKCDTSGTYQGNIISVKCPNGLISFNLNGHPILST